MSSSLPIIFCSPDDHSFIDCMKVFKIDNDKATKSEAPKDANAKPEPTKKAVKFNMIAFITILNSPNVMSVIGKESKNKIGFTTKFRIPKTILAPIATQTLST